MAHAELIRYDFVSTAISVPVILGGSSIAVGYDYALNTGKGAGSA